MPILTDIITKDLAEIPISAAVEASVKSVEDSFKTSNPKYLQIFPVKDGDIIKEVHEYKCPDGSVGWQAFIKATVDKKNMVKSFGEGKEANSRSHDWVEIIEDIYG